MYKARRTISRFTLVAGLAATSLAGVANATAAHAAGPTGPVGTVPAAGTPHLATTGTTEQIRQIVQCGSTMYAVGSFTAIASGKTNYTRGGAFSFSATAPYAVTTWDPEVNGVVNSIAFNGTNCSDAYLGGKFTTIGSTAAKNVAEVDTTTGAVVTAFKSNANAEVETIVSSNGHLLTGGNFTAINGSSAAPYFTSLSPTTGKDDGYLQLAVAGNYVYTDQGGTANSPNATRIYNQQVSPDGTRDLVEGDFTTIGGQARRQVAMLDLGATSATTDAWYASEFDQNCATVEPFYAQAGAWSPDGSTVYIASTGYKPATGLAYNTWAPRSGLCDSAAAFPTTSGTVTHTWINYTGCDSLYSTAADASTAYFGGHERWANNSLGCDSAGFGATAAQGMVGLAPSSGSVTYNPTRARGLGADDMLITSQGLWIASDNYQNSNQCGGVAGLAGLCLMPYAQ